MIGEATAPSSNIAATRAAAARDRPDALAVLDPWGRARDGRTSYRRTTFAELNALCDDLAFGLTEHGFGPGVRTVLMVRPGLEFFALTFALFKAGAVPVLVDPGLGIRNLGRCLAEAEPGGFIGIPRAQLARKLFGWARATIREVVPPTRSPGPSNPTTPTPPPRSSLPAGAPARPRAWSAPTPCSGPRSSCSGRRTGSSRARSTFAPSPCSPCSPRPWV